VTTTQYYTATSIDGFIADQNNSLGWLFESGEGNAAFGDFFARIGAFVMGATTYEWIWAHEKLGDHPEKWAEWYGTTPAWVFTHRELPRLPGANITFVSGDVRPVHEAMTAAAAGRDIWVVGGGELAGCFADHGLLDELILGVAPVTLGGGAPLLPRRLTSPQLELVSAEADGGFAHLKYRLRHPDPR
jgi:dihydrofolate reductase